MALNPYYQFGMCFQRLYPYAIFRLRQKEQSNEVHKVAYITFDDGPIPEVTPRVLDILKQYGVKATFFMVGENIDKYPDLFLLRNYVIKSCFIFSNSCIISAHCLVLAVFLRHSEIISSLSDDIIYFFRSRWSINKLILPIIQLSDIFITKRIINY